MQQTMEPNLAHKTDQIKKITDEFDEIKTLDQIKKITDEFDEMVTLEGQEELELDEDDSDYDFEFFVGEGDLKSPVPAEDIFQNGQIRPIFPYKGKNAGNSEEATTSYDPPVRKVFIVSESAPENEGEAEVVGEYCSSSSENPPAPEMSRKSNSTGFSKLWKVRDLLSRSHSDGKDAFVFLTGKSDEKVQKTLFGEKKDKKVNIPKIKVGRLGGETTSNEEKKGKKSAYEVLYGKREKKTGKSYLPYRQDLVGFFTNASGMSRNVHPY